MNSLGVLAVRVLGSWALGVLFYAHEDVNAPRWACSRTKSWLSAQKDPFSLSCRAGFDGVLSRWRALQKSSVVSLGCYVSTSALLSRPDSKTKAAPQDMRN